MPNILDDFKKVNSYFDENKKRVIGKYRERIIEFETIYNEIVKNLPPATISAELGTALALQYRALKFLYSAFRLVLEGHTNEGMVLLRNSLEVRIVALDIGFNKKAFNLWRIAQSAKEYLRKRDGGVIDSIKLKKVLKENYNLDIVNNLKFGASFKRAKENQKVKERVIQMIRSHGDISEYVSHENIFNLVRRIDVIKNLSGNEQTEVYMGYDASSNIEPFFNSIIQELKDLWEEIRLVKRE